MVGINTANKAGVYSRHLLQYNRITIPKPLVYELKLKYTDKLAMVSHNGKIIIEPISTISPALTKKTHRKASKTTASGSKKNQKRKSLKQVLIKGSPS